MQEELGETMYTPAGCGGRRRVRPVGLARCGVTEQGPVAAVILVADDKVKTCEHGKEKSLELQESVTPVGGPFGGTELGPLGLGREGEGLVRHSRRLHGDDVYPRCRGRRLRGRRKEKRSSRTLSANWENSVDAWTGRHSGLRWTPVDARDRAGPATLDSHSGDATRRLGVAGP